MESAERVIEMTRSRLDQAERTIKVYMDHPTKDPTKLASKEHHIQRLEDENKELKQLNQVVYQSMMHRILDETNENKQMERQIQELQEKLASQPQQQLFGSTRRQILQAPDTFVSRIQPSTSTPRQTDIPTRIDEAGTSSPMRDNNPMDIQEEHGDEVPTQEEADREFESRLNRISSKQLKECMEWEQEILDSAALSMLTPKDIQQSYKTPQLPLPILKLQVQMLKKKLLPQCETNELGGYADMPINDYQVMDIEKNQPRWRNTWLSHSRFHKLHYVNAPQEIRIDPAFCPVRRHRDWDTFNRIATGDRQTWLNYPVLSPPPPRSQPTEQYVINTLKSVVHRMENLPDLSCMMLVKICRMLLMAMTAFRNLPKAGPHWKTYFEGHEGFAWNLELAPSKEILMGIYGRCIFLPSHFMNTFKEAFYTGFFKYHSEIFSGSSQDPLSRYVAFRRTEIEHPVADLAIEARKQAAIDWFERGAAQDRSGR